MKRTLAHRPTPATVISCIALFVALGGVSYGVATNSIDTREIADNTVRSKDIRNNGIYGKDLRNNEVRAIDIRNNTIRGRDIASNTLNDDQIDESKLQQVPSAAAAGDAARLGGRPPSDFVALPEPVRLIGAAGQPAFENGATAGGGGNLAPGFWRDGSGVVRLQGAIDSAAAVTAFTLPAGYRPSGTVRYAVPVGTAILDTVTIDPDGTVEALAGGAPLHLDSITFRAASTP